VLVCTSGMELLVGTLRLSRSIHWSIPLVAIEGQKYDNDALCIVM
jgi:hypothetical protein